MNRILSAFKLDFRTARPALRLSTVTYVASIVIGVLTGQPLATLVLVIVFAVFTGGSIFSTQEKSHCERLYGILPLRRAEMVAGRYLYAAAIGLANIALAVLFAYAISRIMGVALDRAAFIIVASLSFVYYGFAAGVSYPIYFRFNFAKAYIFAMSPWYLILFGLILLSKTPSGLDGFNPMVDFLAGHLGLTPLIGLMGGLILLAVSALVSNWVYRKKEL